MKNPYSIEISIITITYLLKNIEYHLLGNHLLENAFSLLFGAYYFQDHIAYIINLKKF